MVRLSRGASRGNRGKMGRGRGAGPPPPLMARNNVMPPPIPPHMPPPRMRPLPPPGMRTPPFAPPIPPPLPPPPPPHMRPPPPRLPPVPPVPHMRRNLPYPPRPPPMFPLHGPIPRMPPPPIPPPLMRGRGRIPRGMQLRQGIKARKLGLVPFKPRRGKRNKPTKEKSSEGDFFCVPCDRGFKTEEKLQEHCSEHVVCSIDGCTLTAHKKIIDKHIHLVHDSGLYDKVGNKHSPEDVAQWIAERKRNYPTKKNIEEKIAQVNEMEQRGERIHEDKSRFQNKSGARDKNLYRQNQNEIDKKSKDIKRNDNSGKKFRQRKNKLKPVTDCEIEQQDSWRGSLPHFPGIDMFPEESDKNINDINKEFSDEEWTNDAGLANKVSANSKPLASVLSALSVAYGSESDLSCDEDNNKNIKEKETDCCSSSIEQLSVAKVNINKVEEKSAVEIESDSGPEETAIKHESDPSLSSTIVINKDASGSCAETQVAIIGEQKKNSKRNRKRKRMHKKSEPKDDNEKNKSICRPKHLIPKKRLTLLQKLLEPEIRYERNVILQCVRYIVENNFFGIGQ